MSLYVQMQMAENKLIGEKIVTPRLVNQQTVDFETFCDYLAQGSTVTAADVSAVMKQLEKTLPLILCLNAKVMASPDGLTFRPSVRGSITQSQLRARLEAKKAELLRSGDVEGAAKVDTARALKPSDLTVGDLTPCIAIDMPKKWDARFEQSVDFKRVNRSGVTVEETEPENTEPETTEPEPALFTLTWKHDGTVQKTEQLAEGADITEPAAPSGYHWKDVPATMPGHALEIVSEEDGGFTPPSFG